MNPKLKRELLENMILLGIALILCLGIRSTVAEAVVVPTPSMVPTIQVQDHLIVEKISYKFDTIKRGDIVAFDPPEYVQKDGPNWIKRVIGLPGETVEIKDGLVYINGQQLEENYILEEPAYHYGPTVIPEDTYFVMGDNRNNSNDSHCWGVLPKKNILGRAIVTFWPVDRAGLFNN